VLGITETGWRFGLRVVVEGGSGGADQAGVLGLPPALALQMHPATVSRLARADTAAVAFYDRQGGRTFGPHRQSVVGLGIGVTALGQFLTDVMYDPLDRFEGNSLTTHAFDHDRSPLE